MLFSFITMPCESAPEGETVLIPASSIKFIRDNPAKPGSLVYFIAGGLSPMEVGNDFNTLRLEFGVHVSKGLTPEA